MSSIANDIKLRKNALSQQLRKHHQLLYFMIPGLLYLLVFNYYPMFGVQIAFKDFIAAKGIWNSPWVGFAHFKTFFNSFYFKRVVVNTLLISMYNLVTQFPLTIIFALTLNVVRNEHFKKFTQTVTYIPHFISVVVLVGILNQVLNPVTGLYGNLYRMLISDTYPKDILSQSRAFLHLYVWSGIWQNLGWGSIIYIAALSNVNPELHESAVIDGASRFARIIHIDLPAILPTASVMLILRFGQIMGVGFEKVYLMQNNLNLVRSETIATHVYKVGMTGGGNFSYASAIGLFNSVINCTMLFIVNMIARRFPEGASLW